MLPIISVIVPVYNAEKYLADCIKSILNQEFDLLELILINDGSTDDSLAICEQYARLDGRVKVVNKENGGVSEARNKGIELAAGTYILFVDSDDFISDRYLLSMYERAEQQNADITVCSLVFYYDSDTVNTMIAPDFESRKMTSFFAEGLFLTMYQRHLLSGPGNKLFRTRIIKEKGLKFDNKLSICEDGLFVYTFLTQCGSIAGTEKATYYYRQLLTEPHLMTSFNENAFEAQSKYFDMVYELLLKNEASSITMERICNDFFGGYFRFLKQIYISGEYNKKDAYTKLQECLKEETFSKMLRYVSLRKSDIFGGLVMVAVKTGMMKPLHYLLLCKYWRNIRNAK